MKGHTEEELVQKLANGDRDAFRLIFDEYYRPLTIFATKYVGDVEDAKEVVQDLFVRFWLRNSGHLSIRTSLKMYLYQSVRNACLNYLETNKVVQRRMLEYSPDLFSKETALDHLVAAEQEETLMRAVDRLPEKCRNIFLLSRMDKLSNSSIAAKLNISKKTVEAQISIALKRLSESLITLFLFFL